LLKCDGKVPRFAQISQSFVTRLESGSNEFAKILLKAFSDWIAGFIFFARETRENTRAIGELREEIDEMSIRLEKLDGALRLVAQHDQSEREKLVLQLENALLKLERRLPESKSSRNKR
jgi:hypothetical protein